ncbi:MAG: hypothetical protein M1826_000688 [Phylliscum demangeonii]|nr:MAG: hypothetical protein M1826_000688 [Phylliscum demangeonii]
MTCPAKGRREMPSVPLSEIAERRSAPGRGLPLTPSSLFGTGAGASSFGGAVRALASFLATTDAPHSSSTVILSGAGISVASGLADYRGAKGTYVQNKQYRPIYFPEFVRSHNARRRYWARSFLGWPTLERARPNPAHRAVAQLGEMGVVKAVITQNVDSLHPRAHPDLSTTELHGFLRALVCLSCGTDLPRAVFQRSLACLNPLWAAFLDEVTSSGALETEDPEDRQAKGMRTNPDGDVDLPDAPYWTFRYPACPTCLATPPVSNTGSRLQVEVDADGAWLESSTAGVLKPAVIMFGENVSEPVKLAAESAIDNADRILVVGTSLATYSAWRLVRRAQGRGMRIGIVNLGGVRGEEDIFPKNGTTPDPGVRIEMATDQLLPAVVEEMKSRSLS